MEYVNFISQSRGYATYTFSNQFNNSCYSNTIKVFKGNQLNIYSSLPIKKNEQVIHIFMLYLLLLTIRKLTVSFVVLFNFVLCSHEVIEILIPL